MELRTYEGEDAEIELSGTDPSQDSIIIQINSITHIYTVFKVISGTNRREKVISLVEREEFEVMDDNDGCTTTPYKWGSKFDMSMRNPVQFGITPIRIPVFGVTFLGSVSGFDPQGTNTSNAVYPLIVSHFVMKDSYVYRTNGIYVECTNVCMLCVCVPICMYACQYAHVCHVGIYVVCAYYLRTFPVCTLC